jgi:putative ABC transport system permease protein
MGPFRLAIHYIYCNKLKTCILIACIFLTAILPFAIKRLLNEFNDRIMARANATPVVVGAKGSPLDLALHALYFKTGAPGTIPVSEMNRLLETGLAEPIPIHAKYTARTFPIIGTSIEYFSFRKLKLAAGTEFAILGECVIGAAVASELNLGVGDSLMSDRENVIDIAGLYPLKMKIVGVLTPSLSSDDQAVFVDLNTVWVIAGLGHGHEDVAQTNDAAKILRKTDTNIVASPAVLPYTEVTEANLESFHFHGEPETFPITAIIALPKDVKAKTILEGQYDSSSNPFQYVVPTERVEELMNMVFRIKLFFDANALLVAISTLLLLGLVVMLSLRLRKREMQTMVRIGCSKGTVAMLLIWELAIVFAMALGLVLLAVLGLEHFAAGWIESLLMRESS